VAADLHGAVGEEGLGFCGDAGGKGEGDDVELEGGDVGPDQVEPVGGELG